MRCKASIPRRRHGKSDTDTDILADFRAMIVARMSVRDARVCTCTKYTFTKLHDRRIPNVRIRVVVGPVEFQLKDALLSDSGADRDYWRTSIYS